MTDHIDFILNPEPGQQKIPGRLALIRGLLESGITRVVTTRRPLGKSLYRDLSMLEPDSGVDTLLFGTVEGAIEAGTGAALAGMSSAVVLTGGQLLSELECLRRLPLIRVPGGLVLIAVEEPGIDVRQAAVSAFFPTIQPVKAGSLLKLVSSAFNISRSLRTPFLIRIPSRSWVEEEHTDFGPLPDGKHISEPVFPDSGGYSFVSAPHEEAVKRAREIVEMIDNDDFNPVVSDDTELLMPGFFDSTKDITCAGLQAESISKVLDTGFSTYSIVHLHSYDMAEKLLKLRQDHIVSAHPVAMSEGLISAGVNPVMAVIGLAELYSKQAGDILLAARENRDMLLVVISYEKGHTCEDSSEVLDLFGYVEKKASFSSDDKEIHNWIMESKNYSGFRLLVMHCA